MNDRVVQNRPTRPFEFPDGYNAYFGAMRTSIPEVLFNPQRFLPAEVPPLSPAPFSNIDVIRSTQRKSSHPLSRQSLPTPTPPSNRSPVSSLPPSPKSTKIFMPTY